jgi:hypothetical protein
LKIAYIDESGDTGTGTWTYTLGCVVLEAGKWAEGFDEVIAWRRDINARFGVPVRAELKANYLKGSRGTFKDRTLSPADLQTIYREGLELLEHLDAQVFGIVIDKRKITEPTGGMIFETAWTYAFQRLEKMSSRSEPILIVHDDGERERVKAVARKARRAGFAGSAFGAGSIKAPLVGLIDDPVARNSAENYFIQLADMVAYCAFRKVFPAKRDDAVVPNDLWDSLGSAVYTAATSLKPGMAPGIVLWPK